MVDPSRIHGIAGAALVGGAMVLFGAGYAIFHALAGLTRSRRFAYISLASYAALVACALALVPLLGLEGWWLGLIALLLIGYFVAPRFIWRLSLAVHGEEGPERERAGPREDRRTAE